MRKPASSDRFGLCLGSVFKYAYTFERYQNVLLFGAVFYNKNIKNHLMDTASPMKTDMALLLIPDIESWDRVNDQGFKYRDQRDKKIM